MLKSAIWGAGGIANVHADALQANGIAIAAVVSVTAEEAGAFARRWNIPKYGADPEILFGSEIDCVHICTPPNLHFDMAMEALRRGKHVICEKPLCFDNEQARILRDTAREKGLVCATNFNVRFHMACQEARKIVSAPDFGRVLLIHGNYLQEFGALPAPRDWRFNPKLAGRMHAVTEIGTHWMDIAQYISGRKITAVSAQFDHFHPVRYVENNVMYDEPAPGRESFEVDSEDVAIVSMRFEGGAIGVVTLSELSQGRYNLLSLEVTGEKKNIWWNSEAMNQLHYAEKGGTVQSKVFAFGNGFNDTFRSLIGAVYQDVARGCPGPDPVYPTFDDGMRNVMLCNAIYESAADHSKWVELPPLREV